MKLLNVPLIMLGVIFVSSHCTVNTLFEPLSSDIKSIQELKTDPVQHGIYTSFLLTPELLSEWDQVIQAANTLNAATVIAQFDEVLHTMFKAFQGTLDLSVYTIG